MGNVGDCDCEKGDQNARVAARLHRNNTGPEKYNQN